VTAAKRFRGVIARVGEAFEGGTAVFAPLTREEAGSLLPLFALSEEGPFCLAYVPFDDTTAIGATVTWQEREHTVARIVELRYAGESVVRMLVLTAA
jgi:hypothetical protein